MRIYKHNAGYTAIKGDTAYVFSPSLKRVRHVKIAPHYQENGVLLRGRDLPKNVLFQIIKQL